MVTAGLPFIGAITIQACGYSTAGCWHESSFPSLHSIGDNTSTNPHKVEYSSGAASFTSCSNTSKCVCDASTNGLGNLSFCQE